jgi:hypothetical protein
MVCRVVFIRLVLLGMAAVAASSGQTATSAAAEIQPLLTTQWGQRGLYAKYVPNNERLGCWSVALAQILYYHRVQPAGQVSYEGDGYRVRESLDHRFDWDLFADTVTEATPARKQNEVAKYCYYAAIVIGKDFAGEAAYHGNSDAGGRASRNTSTAQRGDTAPTSKAGKRSERSFCQNWQNADRCCCTLIPTHSSLTGHAGTRQV